MGSTAEDKNSAVGFVRRRPPGSVNGDESRSRPTSVATDEPLLDPQLAAMLEARKLKSGETPGRKITACMDRYATCDTWGICCVCNCNLPTKFLLLCLLTLTGWTSSLCSVCCSSPCVYLDRHMYS